MTDVQSELEAILENVPPRLLAIPEDEASKKAGPDRWSRKEILGHLIDSAGNNHQRFVRAQFVARVDFPAYDQNLWVAAQSYATEPWTDLVNLWVALNRHILHLVKVIPESALTHTISIGGKPPMTLSALIPDYLRHLNHHLAQILPLS